MTVNLLGLDGRQFEEFCISLGEKPFRARQLMRWIHHAGVDDFGAMTDMSKSLRAELSRTGTVTAPAVTGSPLVLSTVAVRIMF